MRRLHRAGRALLAAVALSAMVSGAALADTFTDPTLGAAWSFGGLTSKTINTTTGECVRSHAGSFLADGKTPCGAAVYGENGFTGRIYGSGTLTLFDYICVHTPGAGAFKSFGGTATLTLTNAGGTVIGSVTETIVGGKDCDGYDDNGAVTSAGITVNLNNYGGVVSYRISYAGVTSANAQATFSAYNSIRNEVYSDGCKDHARSASVAPPGPPVLVPEAPAAVMLLLSGGLTALGFLGIRGMRKPAAAGQGGAPLA